jgi:hypothetical protein
MDLRPKRKLLAAVWPVALGVAVSAGCAGTPTTSATYQNPDSRGFAQSAMSVGPMLVKIQGHPYAVSGEQTEEVVLSAMSRAMSWTATPRLTTDPAAAKVPSMVVVMTFNSGVIDANAQCSGDSRGGEPQPQGAVQVAASFCGSGSLISNTTGHIDETTGVGDPRFAELISQVTYDLFPYDWQQPPGMGIQIGGGSGGVGIGGGLGIGIGIRRW